MEDTLMTDYIPTNQDKHNDFDDSVGLEITDSVEMDNISRRRKFLKRFQRNVARRLKGSSRGKKYLLLRMLKRRFPNVSLREFCDLYVKSSNIEDIEEQDIFKIADSVENEDEDHARGRRRKRRARRKARRKTRRSRRRKKLKKIAGRVRKAARKAKSKLKKAAGNLKKRFIGMTLLTPLLPFRPMMRKILKSKGYSSSIKTPFLDIVKEFYNRVVKKSKNYDGPEIDTDWLDYDPLMYNSYEDYDDEQELQDHIVESAVKGIVGVVKAVIRWVKKARRKKKDKVKMTTAEKITADATDTLIKDHEVKTTSQLAKDEAKLIQKEAGIGLPTGSKKQMTTMIVGIAILAIVLIFAGKK